MNEQTICANCKHKGYGRGVIDGPAEPGRVSLSFRPSTRRGDVICLRHTRGRERVNPVTGLGGEVRALYCEDVNDGACPDFQPVHDTDSAVLIASMVACLGILVIFALLALGVIPPTSPKTLPETTDFSE